MRIVIASILLLAASPSSASANAQLHKGKAVDRKAPAKAYRVKADVKRQKCVEALLACQAHCEHAKGVHALAACREQGARPVLLVMTDITYIASVRP